MTTLPAGARTPQMMAPRSPGAAPAASNALQAPTIDPVKLLKKYLWVLIASGIVGGALGYGLFQLLRQTSPVFNSRVVFEALPPPVAIDILDPDFTEDERQLLIANQAALIESNLVLEAVVNDPRLPQLAPAWREQFVEDNGQFNPTDARIDLEKRARIRIDRETSFFELVVGWRTKKDARGLAQLIKEAYLARIRTNTQEQISRRTESIRVTIRDLQNEIEELKRRRDDRLDRGEIYERQGRDVFAIQLAEIASQLNRAQTDRTGLVEQAARLENMAGAEPGAPVQFDDAMLQEANATFAVADLERRVRELELLRQSYQEQGVAPAHFVYQRNENQIAAVRTKLDETRQAELQKLVFANLDAVRLLITQVDAQIADYQSRRDKAETALGEQNRLFNEIEQLERELQRKEASLASQQDTEADLEARVRDQEAAARVTVVQNERTPDRIASPKMPIVVGLTFVAVVGLTGSLIVAREVLDQRVKGPSDIAIIPRATVLGFVPLAAEDPANPEHFETIFRDSPRGVLSESLRQLRTTILKRVAARGHKTLLIASGAPGSGSTSMISNLATACAAVDKRVLVIDANFRRPGLHRAFGLDSGRGLSDVLAGDKRVSEVVQKTENEQLDVLTAGSPELRIFERLGTGRMSAALAQASEEYDVVLIDVAPAVVAGDALTLSTLCDASILVVRAMSERRGMVARLKNEMSDTRAEFLGIIVNGVRAAAGGYMKRNIRTSHEYHAGDESELAGDAGPKRGKRQLADAGPGDGESGDA